LNDVINMVWKQLETIKELHPYNNNIQKEINVEFNINCKVIF